MAHHIFMKESKHNYKRLGVDANIMLAEPTQHLKEKRSNFSQNGVFFLLQRRPISKLVKDLSHQLCWPPLLLQTPKDSAISLFP